MAWLTCTTSVGRVADEVEAAPEHAAALPGEVLGVVEEREVVQRDDERGRASAHGTRPVAWATSTGPVARSTAGQRKRSHVS